MDALPHRNVSQGAIAATGRPESQLDTPQVRKTIAPLTVLLAVVFVSFCGILVFVYVATKRANPVMLDQQGKPLDASSAPAKSGAQ
jgi:hypothetical protein